MFRNPKSSEQRTYVGSQRVGNGWEGPSRARGPPAAERTPGDTVRHEGMGEGAHGSPGVWTSENPRGVNTGVRTLPTDSS